MNLLKSLAGPKKKEASGPLTNRTIQLDSGAYRVEGVLGEGGAAVIYRAVDVATTAPFALKHFNLSGDPEAERDVMTEISLMRALAPCPHVLNLRDASLRTDTAFLLLELCDGTLAGHLATRTVPLTDSEVTTAFLPVARAVAALHALPTPMAHRDVKAENVLRRANGSWVLCDFGSATGEQKVYSTAAEIAREEERIRKHTTPAYRAPELWDLLERRFVGLSVDIWALGCLLYLLAYGKLPYDGESKLQALNGAYPPPPPGARPQAVADLVAACLVADPVGRISAAEVVARAERMMSGNSGRSSSSSGGAVAAGAAAVAAGRSGPMGAAVAAAGSGDVWGREFDAVAPTQRAGAVAAAVAATAPESGAGWADFGSNQAAVATNGPAASMAPAPQQQRRPSAAAPPTAELGGLRLGAGGGDDLAAAQLREHCQVLEQLLEERNAEVAALRAAAAARAEEEAVAARSRVAETAALRAEVAALRARAEEAEAAAAAALRRQRSGSGSLTSFPVAGDGEEAPPRVMGGMPMRPGSGMGRVSPDKGGPGPAPGGRRDSFFGDLNPLG